MAELSFILLSYLII